MASASEIFFGEPASDVDLGPEQRKRRKEGEKARALLADIGAGRRESPAVEAARAEGAAQAEEAQQALRSQVASARGPGAQLLARRAAQGLQGRTSADIAAQTARAVGQISAQEQQQARAQGLQERQFAEQAAAADEEERRRRARRGLLSVLTTAQGAVAGGLVGGPQGALAGGQLGQSVGRAFERN